MADADADPASRVTRPLTMEGVEPFFYPRGETGCLLVHGLSSSPFTMREMGARLAASGVSVAAPLLAGHGTSPEDLRNKTWGDWVTSAEVGLEQLRAHGCRRIYLTGLSLGGAICLYLAARDPQAYAGMITMSAPVWIPTVLRVPLNAAGRRLPYLATFTSDIADPAAHRLWLTYDRLPLATCVTLIDLLAQVREGLDRITLPSLIIYARHDHLVHPMNSMHIYSRISSSDKRLAVLHHGYHIVTVDRDKERVFALADEFIGRTR
ncbi:MAG: alpha/beta hydrolase [Chloroflexia bacterium]